MFENTQVFQVGSTKAWVPWVWNSWAHLGITCPAQLQTSRNLQLLMAPYVNFQWEKGIMTWDIWNYSKPSHPRGAGISPAAKFPLTKPQPTAWALSQQSGMLRAWKNQHSQSSPSLDSTELLSHIGTAQPLLSWGAFSNLTDSTGYWWEKGLK